MDTNEYETSTAMAPLARFLEAIMTPSAPVFIIGALIIILLPVLLHLILVRAAPYIALPSILLIGPSGGGKTSLITLFERGDAPAGTHTSQVPHSVEFTAASNSASKNSFREKDDTSGTHTKFLLVDTPGHGKLRQHAFSKINGTAGETKLKAIVFVVDAASLGEPETLAPAASYLYDVLLGLQKRASTAKTARTPTPILIAANKLDLFTALPATLVKSTLEAELTRIRSSRSKSLLDSGVGTEDIGSEEHDDWLGEYGSKGFDFGQMAEFGIEVDVLGGSVTGGDGAPAVDQWWTWITDKI
jgi:signal recognition particle receptor subunit beta